MVYTFLTRRIIWIRRRYIITIIATTTASSAVAVNDVTTAGIPIECSCIVPLLSLLLLLLLLLRQ